MTDTDDPTDTSTIDERIEESLNNIKSGIDRLQSDNTYLENRLDTLKSDNTYLKNRLERLQSERDARDDLQNRLAVAATVLEKVIARLKRSGDNHQWSLAELTALLALTTGKSDIVYDENNHIVGIYDPIKHKQAWIKSKDLSSSSPTIPTGASGPGTYTYKTTPTVPVGAVGPGSSDESEFFPSFWDGDLSNCPAIAWRDGGACDRDCGKTCRRW